MTRKSKATFDPGDEPWRCCARAKNSGERCHLTVVPGRRVCRKHGGNNPGRAPITGQYSAVFKRLRHVYERCRTTSAILDMSEPLALMATIVHRMVERVEELDTEGFRLRALGLYHASRDAIREGDGAEGGALLEELGALLQRGADEDSALMRLMSTVTAQMNGISKAQDQQMRKDNVIPKEAVALLVLKMMDTLRDVLDKVNAATAINALETSVYIPSGLSDGATGEGFLSRPARIVEAEEPSN